MIFYTDALTEAMTPSQRDAWRGRAARDRSGARRRVSPSGSARPFSKAIRDHRAGVAAEDDVTLLVLHHNGGPPRKPSIGEKLDIYAKVFGLKSV